MQKKTLLIVLISVLTLNIFVQNVFAETYKKNDSVIVCNTSGDGLNVRETPGTGKILGTLKDGAKGVILDGPQLAGKYVWYKIQWSQTLSGWSASDYIKLFINDPPSPPIQNPPGTPNYIKGMDISRWQVTGTWGTTPIDWQKVKDSGIVFDFVKMTEGTEIIDAWTFDNMRQSKAAGIITGVYHICWPKENDALSEANYFIQNAKPFLGPGYMVPVLDIEPSYNLGGAKMVQWIDTFNNEVMKYTRIPIILYCNGNVAKSLKQGDPNIDKRYPIWIASYRDEPDTKGWNGWQFWQYTSSGHVDGISRACDLDYFNGSMDDLKKYIIGDYRSLTISNYSGGTIEQDPSGITFEVGTEINLKATPSDGYRFSNWVVDDGSTVLNYDTQEMKIKLAKNTKIIPIFSKIDDEKIKFYIGNAKFYINNKENSLTVAPFISGGTSFIPAKQMAEFISAKTLWEPNSASYRLFYEDEEKVKSTLLIVGNSSFYILNNKQGKFSASTIIKNGVLFVPAREFASLINLELEWSPLEKTLTFSR